MKLEPVIKGDSRFNTAVARYHGLGKFVFLYPGATPQALRLCPLSRTGLNSSACGWRAYALHLGLYRPPAPRLVHSLLRLPRFNAGPRRLVNLSSRVFVIPESREVTSEYPSGRTSGPGSANNDLSKADCSLRLACTPNGAHFEHWGMMRTPIPFT